MGVTSTTMEDTPVVPETKSTTSSSSDDAKEELLKASEPEVEVEQKEKNEGPEIKIEQLFNTSWFSKDDGNDILRLGLLLFYTPIGLLLFVIRTFIATQFLLLKAILPESKVKQKAMRVMGTVLGVTISTEGQISCPTFVSNNITAIDHFVMYAVTNASYVKMEMTQLPSPVVRLLCIYDGMLKKASIPKLTLVFFPEKETTNGQFGLLSFYEKVLLDETVQPVGLTVTRPLLNVNTVQSGMFSELFFLFFLPYTHYTIKFLPPETYDELQTQKTIASSINSVPTKFKAADKAEFVRKLNYRPPSIATMARTVQQQLHPVILSPESILAALQKTGSVEKAVEELRKSFTEPSFPKSASQRMMSFQEKKRLMIATARKKYCEQNGLEF